MNKINYCMLWWLRESETVILNSCNSFMLKIAQFTVRNQCWLIILTRTNFKIWIEGTFNKCEFYFRAILLLKRGMLFWTMAQTTAIFITWSQVQHCLLTGFLSNMNMNTLYSHFTFNWHSATNQCNLNQKNNHNYFHSCSSEKHIQGICFGHISCSVCHTLVALVSSES